MKKCTKCKIEWELSNFTRRSNSKDGLNSICKSCIKNYPKSGNLDKEYYRQAQKAYYFKKVYSCTIDYVKGLYELQEGKCAICGVFKKTFSTPEGLAVDHCHKTGKVRGLLCHKCNLILGLCNDNTEILENGILYLNIHKKEMTV